MARTKHEPRKKTHKPPTLVGIGEARRVCSLRFGVTTVGSAAGNTYVLDEPTVSGHHAEIRHRFGRITVRDLRSTNGTYVNGARIERRTIVDQGDEVRFGSVRLQLLGQANRQRLWRFTLRAPVLLAFMLALGFVSYEFTDNWISSLRSQEMSRTAGPTPAPISISSSSAARGVGQTPRAAPSSISRPAGLATITAPIASGRPSSGIEEPGWLKLINHYRQLAQLAPISEDAALSRGDRAHAEYLVRNFSEAIRDGTGGRVGQLVEK